jgi:hypothetical protein
MSGRRGMFNHRGFQKRVCTRKYVLLEVQSNSMLVNSVAVISLNHLHFYLCKHSEIHVCIQLQFKMKGHFTNTF